MLLPDEEAHHLRVVLRLRSGDGVEVLDGKGNVATGTLSRVERGEVAVRITRLRRAEPVRPLLTVATAVPKGKRWQQLVEKCTELGASRIRPVRFRQSVAEGGSDPAKWRRWAVEAAKQCGRAWLPEVPAPVDLGAFLGEADAGVAYVCDPRGEPLLKFAAHMGVAEAVTVLVGPEAGLMPEEAELCREHGLAPLRLGPHVLRIETAAQAACAAVRALLQE